MPSSPSRASASANDRIVPPLSPPSRGPVAGEACLAEPERFALVGQRNLAHGRRLDRLAAVVADQFSHLRRTAALEADYPVARSTPEAWHLSKTPRARRAPGCHPRPAET